MRSKGTNLISPEEKALLRVQALVKVSAEEIAMPEDGHYYDQLHDKIMAAVVSSAVRSQAVDRAGSQTNDWMPLLTSLLPARAPSSKKY